MIISSTRYSFILIWLFALPLLVQTEFFLKIWLGDKLPADLIIFVQMTILSAIINAINGPLWTAGQVNGKIKNYQIQISSLLILTFFLSWGALLCGATACWIPAIIFGINCIAWVYRVLYLKYVYKFSLRLYCKQALIRLFLLTIVTLVLAFMLENFFPKKFWSNSCVAVLSLCINIGVAFAVGLTNSERGLCIQKVKNLVNINIFSNNSTTLQR